LSKWWLLFILLIPSFAHANQRETVYCNRGGQSLIVSGLTGAPLVDASFPGCTVTVYLTGTLTLATITSDAAGLIPQANPFTADSFGVGYFYAANGTRVDIQLSGAGIPSYTIGDVLLNDSISGPSILPLSNTFSGAVNTFSNTVNLNTVSGNPNFTGAPTASQFNKTVTVDGVTITTLAQAEAVCVTMGGCRIEVPPGTNPTLSAVLTLSVPTSLYFKSPNTVTCSMSDPGITSGCFNVTSSNVNLECTDRSVLFTQPNAQNIEIFMYYAANANVTVRNCRFDWNDANQTNSGGVYATLRSAAGSAGLRVYDNDFTRGGDRTIDFRGASRVWIQRNYFHQSGLNVAGVTNRAGNSVSVDVDGTTQSSDVFCTDNQDDQHGDAFACKGSRIHINGNTIRGAADFGITPLPSEAGIDGSASSEIEVIGNHVINARGPQLYLQSLNEGTVNYVERDLRVEGNSFVANASCCGLSATDPKVVASIAGSGITAGQQTNIGFINNSFDGVRLAIDTINNFQVKGNGFHNILSSLAAGIALNVDQVSNGYGAVTKNFVISGNTFTTDNSTLISAVVFTANVTTPDSCVITDNATSTGVTNDITENSGFSFGTCLITRSNRSIGSYSNGGIFSPVNIQSAGITDNTLIDGKRFSVNKGTPLTSSNFALSGWGSGATVTVSTTSYDGAGRITVTTGSSPSANPTVTLTFADGTWTTNSECPPARGDQSGPAGAYWALVTPTATTALWAFVGTPIATNLYVLDWTCTGK
jgi:hypothetical protein